MTEVLAEQRKKEVVAKAVAEKEHAQKECARQKGIVEVETSASQHTDK